MLVFVLIGKSGIYFVSFKKGMREKELFIDKANQDNVIYYSEFLYEHRNYEVILLLDHDQINLHNENFVLKDSSFFYNPVKEYVFNKFDKSTITSYSCVIGSNNAVIAEDDVKNDISAPVFGNIIGNDGNIAKQKNILMATIVSCPFKGTIEILLDYIFLNSLRYKATYFLSLALPQMAIYALNNSKDNYSAFSKEDHGFIVMIAITRASAIIISFTHRNKLLREFSVRCPDDQSDIYIQGLIEHLVSTKLLEFKDYIKSNNLQISMIFIGNSSIAKNMNDTSYGRYKIYVLDIEDGNKNARNLDFCDSKIIELFNKNKRHAAFNKYLKSITKMQIANMLLFKPMVIFIFSLVAFLIMLQQNINNVHNAIYELNTQYQIIDEEYKKIKEEYPNIKNISKLANFYKTESKLRKKFPEPIQDIKKILSVNANDINVEYLSWQLLDPDLEDKNHYNNISIDKKAVQMDNKSNIKMHVDLKYTSANQDTEFAAKRIDVLFQEIKNIYQDSNVYIRQDDKKIMSLPNMLTVPINIEITEFRASDAYGIKKLSDNIMK